MEKKLKSIIFVDDDEIIGMVSKRLMEQLALASEVLVFSDSYKALHFLKERYAPTPQSPSSPELPDLVFLDIDMPGIGGFQILQQLHSLVETGSVMLQNTHFAIVTSHKTAKDVAQARQLNTLAILEKPLRQHELQLLLQRI